MLDLPEWAVRVFGMRFFTRCLSCRRDLQSKSQTSTSSKIQSSSSTSLNTAVDDTFIRIELFTELNGKLCIRIHNEHPVNWLSGRLGGRSKRIQFHPHLFILPPKRSSSFHVTISTKPYQVEEKRVRPGTLARFISKANYSSKVILVYFWLGSEPPNRNAETCWRQPFLVPPDFREHIVFKLPFIE
ncbi:unnamed protein product [Bursaphelenchus xylophilus]|uniref:(pine wood nematode) hypothetical protein n=1 Tax=Bursaphelenchus xylophilus TaxID=6326 RepID=A0A1I7RMN8_BURXY|nr:unnamed protein product [Bursaphelenchus xylophilus]CAG9125632.1 unnamed protein product [Bursaphelenchus xylophilus]